MITFLGKRRVLCVRFECDNEDHIAVSRTTTIPESVKRTISSRHILDRHYLARCDKDIENFIRNLKLIEDRSTFFVFR